MDNSTASTSVSAPPSFGRQIARQPWFYKLLLALLALLSPLSLVRTLDNTIDPSGGIDLHSYWYSGHFVRQGSDPYWAFVRQWQPDVPVRYLDGQSIQEGPVAQQGLGRTPANTAPMVLLLSLLAYLSWVPAKLLWLILNLLIMLTIPWLLVRLLPPGTVEPPWLLVLSLAFIALSSTRVALWTGQTTLLVYLLMIGAMLTLPRRWLLSGILLGIALSKYTLALPVLLIALYKRRFRVVGVSLLIQLLGILYLVLMTESSAGQIVRTYTVIARRLAPIQGIHLASLFGEQWIIGTVTALLGTLILLASLWNIRAVRRQIGPGAGSGTEPVTRHDLAVSETNLIDFHLFVIATLWMLLVVYHRIYDAAVIIAFIALGIAAVNHPANHPARWGLLRSERLLVGMIVILATGIQLLPGEIMGRFLPAHLVPLWLKLVDSAITLSLVAALIVSIWLLAKIRPVSPQSEPQNQTA